MMRCVASTLVSRILFVPPKMRLTDRRSNTTLWLPASGHIRLRQLLIILLPLALLTGGTARAQSTVSMFSNLVPATPINKTSSPITLGVKFWSSQVGTISAILFYRAAKSPQGYVASLYTGNGTTLLGSVTMATESGPVPGWQQAVFAYPYSGQGECYLRRGLLCAKRPICPHPVWFDEYGDEWTAERFGGRDGRRQRGIVQRQRVSHHPFCEREFFC